MGLLLSVLVACVGVVELLAFCSNVRRTLVTVSTQTSFDDITKRYVEDLERHRRYLQSQIPTDISDEDDESKSDASKQISSEDCKVEFVNALKRSSPKRFPLVEEDSDRSRSPSPQLIFAKPNTDDLLNSLIKEQNKILDESSQNHVRINENESLCPSTKEFLLTERETVSSETSDKPHSRSPSPIPRRLGEEDFVFRRSPSPYPPPFLPVPRNSICKELDTALSVEEVDEEAISRSPTPEKIQAILESKHNSTEYWTNKILVVPPTKTLYYNPLECQTSYSSETTCSLKCQQNSFQVVTEKRERNEKYTVESVLSRGTELMNKDENEIEDEIKELDGQFLDSLDGVSKKKLSRSSSLRRSRKKRTSNSSTDDESKDDCLSSSSMQNNDAQTAKTLTEAANVLKNVNREANGCSEPSAGTSKDGVSKTAEPFWVNR